MDTAREETLGDLWHAQVRRRGGHPFLVAEDAAGAVRTFGYADFDALVASAAAALRRLGVGPGDAVVLHLPLGAELVRHLLAVMVSGAVAVVQDPGSPAPECAHVAQRVRARLAVCTPEAAGRYAGVPGLRVVGPVAAGAVGVGAVGAAGAAGAPGTGQLLGAGVTGSDTAGVVFTSGSTATPKGVVLTHANLVFSGRFVQWQAALTPADRLLTTMPACHVNFQLNALLPVVAAGATLVVVERYSARRFWHQVQAHRATVVQSIAMIVRTQLCRPVEPGERDHDVREILYYLPLPDAEKLEYERRFGVRLLNSYGTSECLVGAITDPPAGERRWPSVGRVGPGYEARVAGPDGRALPPGEPGEIQLRGEPGVSLMAGYLDDPESTAAAYDADGWMRTGDLGYVDADGWYYFLDRRSRIIKRGAENVSPARVEAVLLAHPGIAQAAVVGVPDAVYDEAVLAVVVPRPGVALTEADVRAHCAAHLPAPAVPGTVQVADRLPRTASYKVATGALSARAAARAPGTAGRARGARPAEGARPARS